MWFAVLTQASRQCDRDGAECRLLSLFKGVSKNRLTCASNNNHKDKPTLMHSFVHLLCSIKICTRTHVCTYMHTHILTCTHYTMDQKYRTQFQVGWSQRLIINMKQSCQFQNPDDSAFFLIIIKLETALEIFFSINSRLYSLQRYSRSREHWIFYYTKGFWGIWKLLRAKISLFEVIAN